MPTKYVNNWAFDYLKPHFLPIKVKHLWFRFVMSKITWKNTVGGPLLKTGEEGGRLHLLEPFDTPQQIHP
jgi:hypothetical protein